MPNHRYYIYLTNVTGRVGYNYIVSTAFYAALEMTVGYEFGSALGNGVSGM